MQIDGWSARPAKYKPDLVAYNACACTLYSVSAIANRPSFNLHCTAPDAGADQ